MQAFVWVVALLILGWVALKIYAWVKNREIIICVSCGSRMTLGQFKARGGCQRCGSNLYKGTGERV